ncbi:MAG: cytochrome B [Flavobacteriales bacterium]|nr:cytochrome B [Flavobacteriales bacterium]MBK6944001.1 cytochrome B [Flavobacteriales bacterium]MBK7240206.1 cytochrome B [Flavobacteriales bacterium]MBK9533669.1 cytochrome B [Flavobacteriales bacterium]MBP9136959.1 hypothetical protein [Flavobacteriales bacterium]
MEFFAFIHSLLRYAVLGTVAVAGFAALRGYLTKSPILSWERAAAIIGMILCHVQLVIGLLLYVTRYGSFEERFGAGSDMLRFWKMEHIGTMIVAVALITIGRVLSKKTNTESSKQLRIAVFYLIGLLLMFAMIPWPFMAKFNHMYQWL